jgi:hypothetical protein
MTILSSLKTLPLLAVLATGTGLIPTLALAGNHNDEPHKAKANKHNQQQNNRYTRANHRNNSVNHQGKKRHFAGQNQSRRVVHNRDYRGHRHTHNRYYQQPVSHRSYVQQPHFLSRNGLRLMLGLHSDNIDIVFHD